MLADSYAMQLRSYILELQKKGFVFESIPHDEWMGDVFWRVLNCIGTVTYSYTKREEIIGRDVINTYVALFAIDGSQEYLFQIEGALSLVRNEVLCIRGFKGGCVGPVTSLLAESTQYARNQVLATLERLCNDEMPYIGIDVTRKGQTCYENKPVLDILRERDELRAKHGTCNDYEKLLQEILV